MPRYRTINNDTEINIYGTRLRADPDGLFSVASGSDAEKALIAGGAISDSLCNLQKDESGKVIGLVGLDGRSRQSVRDIINAQNKNVGTEWMRLFGPNELKTWTKSGEWSGGYPVQSFEIFRREGAAMKLDSRYMSAGYATLSNYAVSPAINMAGGTRLGILCYCHRLNANTSIRLRVGYDSGNYKTYTFNTLANQLIEGWNFLVVHTQEDGALRVLQTGGADNAGWEASAGSFNFEAQTVGFMAMQVDGFLGTNYPIAWIEGIYSGGAEARPMITLGFDIQGASLSTSKSILDAYGFKGYAAVPIANGNSANPEYLWSQADRDRLIGLYNAGWDILCHSASHNSLGAMTDPERINCELQSVRQQLLRLGMYRSADLFASPNGSWSNRSIHELARHGYRWQRNVNNAPIPQYDSFVGPVHPLNQGSFSCGPHTLAELNAQADLVLQKYRANCHFYAHEVEAGGDGTNWPGDTARIYNYTLDGFCAHLRELQDAGLCRVVTPSEYLAAIGNINPLDTFSVPSQAPLNVSASPCSLVNAALMPVLFAVSGGTVSAIYYSRDGSVFVATGQTGGVFRVEPGDVLKITYSVVPSVTQMRI